ncbi:MAG: tRNA modification GTPase [Tepidisphaeraceae bacterium]
MLPDESIAAISSAVGPAARMIVRLSGTSAHAIARGLADELPEAGHARRTRLHFADLTVPALVCLFTAPRSYTAENLVEFHISGNPLLARMLLDALIDAGARHAEPGEFTARAYFAGRIDLAEAEGVAAIIAAHGEQELRAARQLLAGELARRLRPAMDVLTQTLALVEAGIDFSEEDVTFLAGEEVERRVRGVIASLDELIASSARFEPLTHEPTFVLVGRPNAGKSTLLNALAGRERAIVSDIAGTTRDVLSAEVRLRRGFVRMLDVAGLEDEQRGETTSGEPARIAVQMLQRAMQTVETADYLVFVHDLRDDGPPIAASRTPDLVVRTKADLSGDASAVSAVTGQGMDALRDRLDRLAFGDSPASSTLALNARHLHAISDARESLARAADLAPGSGAELTALELRDALDALGRVLGQVTPDDVIGRVFATFCIGK